MTLRSNHQTESRDGSLEAPESSGVDQPVIIINSQGSAPLQEPPLTAGAPSPVESQSQVVTQPNEVSETPAETSPKPPSVGTRIWNRRHILSAVVSLTAGSAFALYWRWPDFFPKPPAKRYDNPYFRRRKKQSIASPTTLGEGFYGRKYARPEFRPSNAGIARKGHRDVIQYVQALGSVDDKGNTIVETEVPFVNRFSGKNREPVTDIPPPSTNRHVSLSRASALFELAALQQVSLNQYSAACKLLINGIRHDLLFKKNAGGTPSLRLWDLLARVSVRSGQTQYLDETLQELEDEARDLIAQQPIGTPPKRSRHKHKEPSARAQSGLSSRFLFDSRLNKWRNEEWRAKLRERKTVKWSVTPRKSAPAKQHKKTAYYF